MKQRFVILGLIIGCALLWLPASGLAQSFYPYYPQQTQPPVYYQQYSPPQQLYVQPSYPSWPSQGSGYYWNTPNQMYQYGLQLVYAKRYYEALRVFQEFLRYYPQSSLADNALYWSGECYYAQKQYPIALSYFQRVQYEYPRGNKVPDSMLKSALSYMSMNQYAQGCQILTQLTSRFPNSESARKAYRWMDRCGWNTQTYGGYPYGAPSWYGGYPYGGSAWYGDGSFPKNY